MLGDWFFLLCDEWTELFSPVDLLWSEIKSTTLLTPSKLIYQPSCAKCKNKSHGFYSPPHRSVWEPLCADPVNCMFPVRTSSWQAPQLLPLLCTISVVNILILWDLVYTPLLKSKCCHPFFPFLHSVDFPLLLFPFFFFPSPLVRQWHWAKVGQSAGGQWGRSDRETARQGGSESSYFAVAAPPPTPTSQHIPLALLAPRAPCDVWGTRF